MDLLEVPDLKSYDYLNAADKLEFERLAGLYDFSIYCRDFEEYNRKKDFDMLKGWIRIGCHSRCVPVIMINNSIGVSGRGSGMTYRMNANVRNVEGCYERRLS